MHVSNGIDMDHKRNKSDHAHHHYCQPVDEKPDFKGNAAADRPCIDAALENISTEDVHRYQQGQDQRQTDRPNSHPMSPDFPN